jgi:hypothetical protein
MLHDVHREELDGLSAATAIRVNNVRAEYEWVRQHYPSSVLLQQGLEAHAEGPRDVLTIDVDGTRLRVYFDISSFYGAKRPTAPCPFCGEPMRTTRAKQCRHCKRQWHEGI